MQNRNIRYTDKFLFKFLIYLEVYNPNLSFQNLLFNMILILIKSLIFQINKPTYKKLNNKLNINLKQ